jgi:hypothetical protein
MLKSSFLVIIFIFFFLPENTAGQESNSLQVSGGIISPMSSSRGLIGTIRYNYVLNKNVNLYIYSGYSSWDNYYIFFLEDYSLIQHEQHFRTVGADDHSMIPVYLGSRINFHTIKLFTSFVEFEIGYTYLHFYIHDIYKVTAPETGEVIAYRSSRRTEETEHLFGVGIGAGISHPITEKFSLILAFKLNSHINSNYFGLFSTRGTYTRFTAGFIFNI